MKWSSGRVSGVAAVLSVVLAGSAMAATLLPIYVRVGDREAWVALETLPQVGGTVAYQGPVADPSNPNWKGDVTYTGVRLVDALAELGPVDAGARIAVIATDGFAKTIPASVLSGDTAAGEAILALDRGDSEWEGFPMLVFLASDGRFSNDDMLSALGETYSHYFGDQPSTTGLMVKNVAYVIVDYDGGALPDLREAAAHRDEASSALVSLTIVRDGIARTFTRAEVEAMEAITASGTFTNSADVDYTAEYVGVPLATLIGNVPMDATVLAIASDGYSMNYKAETFFDTSLGTWILAYKENGAYMPFDPGTFRIVQVGPNVPHFTSSLSAKMVERIEILGEYTAYTLTLVGESTRVFARGELEAGIGCPCHTATVTVTSKGETSTFTGLPLWRLLAYVDGGSAPAADEGIHYNDEDFDVEKAAGAYTITLQAEDGYRQTVSSALVARDDRFIVAFKKNGAFLDATTDGAMRFVFDDSVELPDGTSLKSVKFLTTILLDVE